MKTMEGEELFHCCQQPQWRGKKNRTHYPGITRMAVFTCSSSVAPHPTDKSPKVSEQEGRGVGREQERARERERAKERESERERARERERERERERGREKIVTCKRD